MREVIRAITLLGLEELVAEFGGDLRPIAAEVGIELSELQQPQKLLPIRKVHELVNRAAESVRRKDLGLVWGARSEPSRLGPLFVALINAQTAREAIGFLSRYLHVNFPLGAVELHSLPGRTREIIAVRSLLSRPPSMIQFHERRLGSVHVILKLVCGDAYRPAEVWFTHKQNAPAGAYMRVFGVRPLFEMPENGIVMQRSMLDARRSAANAQVRDMALAYLKTQATPPGRSAKAEVANILRILMRGANPTLSGTARALGMHPRTLQRRLRAEASTFEAIKDDVRRSLAEALMKDEDKSLVEIALMLHYANMSAFTRSCRRWFKGPPSRIRAALLKRSRRRR